MQDSERAKLMQAAIAKHVQLARDVSSVKVPMFASVHVWVLACMHVCVWGGGGDQDAAQVLGHAFQANQELLHDSLEHRWSRCNTVWRTIEPVEALVRVDGSHLLGCLT